MFSDENLGKLKHTTKDTCPDCMQSKLQLRIRMVEGKDSEYLFCPRCEYEARPHKSKLDGIWKKQVQEAEILASRPEPIKNNRNNYKRK